MFKFIHAADLHIDSPLRGLEAYPGAPVEQAREATRRAFENLVTLAVEQQVALVVLAGDLFDGQWQDMQTGLWTASQFRRLEREGIPVYLLRGNHDASSKVRQAVSWPNNVHEFSVDRPATFHVEEIGAALHGQGFAHQECAEDLARGYPAPVAGCFNIGVLHTSLTGSTQHDPYAPTTTNVLIGRGYQYWALGHIHQRSDPAILFKPYIAYSGNTQGRHIREAGPRGCFLNTVVDGELESVEFFATDTLRWQVANIELQAADSVPDLIERVRERLAACHAASAGRFSAIRVVIRGACDAHRALVRRLQREETLAEIRNLANELGDEVWIEKVELDTRAPVDLEQLRRGSDLVAELLNMIEGLRSDPALLAEFAAELAPLNAKAALELRECGLELDQAEQLRNWLRQAEQTLVAQLLEAEA